MYDICPNCHVSLIDEDIPAAAKEIYDAEHFTRAQAILKENKEVYLRCPDCGHEWLA